VPKVSHDKKAELSVDVVNRELVNGNDVEALDLLEEMWRSG
jgi:hypothetical protein